MFLLFQNNCIVCNYSDAWLSERYIQCCEDIKARIQGEHISLTTDIWMCDPQDGYLSLSSHYVNKDFEAKKVILNYTEFNEWNTGQDVCDKIDECLLKWEILKKSVPAILHDSGRNVALGVKFAQFEFAYSCFSQDLQLVIEHNLLGQSEMKEMLRNFREMVGHFKHSSKLTNHLLEKQRKMNPNGTPLELKQDVSAHWHSQFEMIERSLLLKTPLLKTISDLDINIDITKEQWALAKDLCDVLSVFYDATNRAEDDQSFLSTVIPYVYMFKKAVRRNKHDSFEIANMKICLLHSLTDIFKDIEKKKFMLVATIMDPRFKDDYFSSPAVKGTAKALFIEKYNELEDETQKKFMLVATIIDPGFEDDSFSSPEVKGTAKALFIEKYNELEVKTQSTQGEGDGSEPQSKLRKFGDNGVPTHTWDSVTSALAAVNSYLAEPRKELKSNPLDYWKNHSNPIMKKLARKYFSALASSTPSDRVLSHAGLTVTELRDCLDQDRVEMLLFLSMNERCLGQSSDDLKKSDIIKQLAADMA